MYEQCVYERCVCEGGGYCTESSCVEASGHLIRAERLEEDLAQVALQQPEGAVPACGTSIPEMPPSSKSSYTGATQSQHRGAC